MANKIRVVFDANPLVRQKTGVGFYTEGMVRALGQIDELELVGCYFKPRQEPPELPKAPHLSYKRAPWLVGILAKALRKAGIRLPWELLFWQKGDVLFFADFTTWPSLFKTPKILTIHDLTYIDFPQYVRRRNLKFLRRYVAHDAKHANLILTISKFSKKRISGVFGLPDQKILAQPIPPGPVAKAAKPAWLPKDYILFISTIEPRKNVGGLIDAYLYLPDSLRQKFSLVLAGGAGWDSDEVIERVHHLQNAGEKIITPGYVGEQERAALYKNAATVVVPSFYEGFGMPILEAFAYRAPVVASDLAVLKEVGANAAKYFNPNSPENMKEVLEVVLGNPTLRQTMAKKGSEELAKYSWQDVATEVSQSIKKLVN